jgi:hypothetical protein
MTVPPGWIIAIVCISLVVVAAIIAVLVVQYPQKKSKLPHNHPAGFIFQPSVWGPVLWRAGHSVTFLYPAKDPLPQHTALIRNYFAMLPHTLPCSLCGVHLIKHMEKDPLTDDVLTNRDKLTRWFVRIHNAVNADLKKPEMAYDDVYRYYMVDSASGEAVPWIVSVAVLSVIVVVLSGILAASIKRR